MLPVFYFFIIRPKQQEMKKLKEMIDNLKKGDKVQTQAGIIGVVSAFDDKTVTLKVNESTKIDFVKSSIQAVLEK
jgi:preprotein translocase subunit YajC